MNVFIQLLRQIVLPWKYIDDSKLFRNSENVLVHEKRSLVPDNNNNNTGGFTHEVNKK